jgi:hypothetical protein
MLNLQIIAALKPVVPCTANALPRWCDERKRKMKNPMIRKKLSE